MPRKGVPLSIADPAVAKDADGWDPATLAGGSKRKMPWRCAQGHRWEATVDNRVGKKAGCPYCSGRLAVSGETDLATTHPELAAQADGWDPKTLSAGSGAKMPWRCSSGHQWTAQVSSRRQGVGCPYCAGQRVIPGETDLATTHPDLAKQARGWNPSHVSYGSNKRMEWDCPEGHVYELDPWGRSQGQGCTVCAGKLVLPGVNDVASLHPALVTESVSLDLAKVSVKSGKRGTWRCSLGHEYEMRVADKTAGRGCPVCANKKVLPGFNDIATTDVWLAKQANGWDPSTLTAGSAALREWVCDLGHVWKTSPVQRTRNGGLGCPYCSGRRVWVGFNDLVTVRPELAAEADGWDPTTVSIGSHARRSWRCSEGHTWKAVVHSRSLGRGCPSCAESGYNPSKDGWLYLLRHDGLDLLQFGLTNVPDQRLSTHRKGGWEILDLRGPMAGDLAAEWERSFKGLAKRRGLTMGKGLGQGFFTGYTEAWPESELSVGSVRDLMDLVEKDEAEGS